MSYRIPGKLYRELQRAVFHGRLTVDSLRENAELFHRLYVIRREQYPNLSEGEVFEWAGEQYVGLETIWQLQQLLAVDPSDYEATATVPLWAQFCAFLLPREKREDHLGDLAEWYPIACQKFHPVAVKILLLYHVASWLWPWACGIGRKLARLGVLGWLFQDFDT